MDSEFKKILVKINRLICELIITLVELIKHELRNII